MSRRVWVIVGVVVVVIAAIMIAWSDVLGLRDGVSPAASGPTEDAGEAWAEDEWMLDEPERPSRAGDRARKGGGRDRGEWGGRWGNRPEPGTPEFEAWRAQRRERWRQAVDIAPLGPTPPAFDADAVREALAPGREALRACMQEAGGFRALRDAMRASRGDAGRPRRSVSFDVRADGTVDPASIATDPPVPAPFDGCFRTFVASARFESAGDGARVEMPLGPRGGRRFREDTGPR